MVKKYLVPGGIESAIGQAVIADLLKSGQEVVATIPPGEDKETQATDFEISAVSVHEVDFSDIDEVLKFANSLPSGFDGIVFAESYFNMENPLNIDPEKWEKSIRVNLIAPNILINRMISRLNDGSSIVLVTSTEGFTGSFGASAYGASKAAVHNLVKTIANNLGSKSIRSNAVAPGWIGGVMDTDEVFDLSRKITPLGRLGSPGEVANVVNFLLSDRASFVNGTVITVDGGYSNVDTIAKFEIEANNS